MATLDQDDLDAIAALLVAYGGAKGDILDVVLSGVSATTKKVLPISPFVPVVTGIADSWPGLAVTSGGDVYACIVGGDIYKRAGGTGAFTALGQTLRQWEGMCVSAAGNVYATAYEDDIYMQSGGAGNFIGLSQGIEMWSGIAGNPNGDVYVCVFNGDIWKQAGGIGNFAPVGVGSKAWRDICIAPNGDIYAVADGEGIYRKRSYGGGWTNMNQISRSYTGLGANPNGDIYATEDGGDIYVCVNGIGDFIPTGQDFADWQAIAATPDGDIYVSINGGDIYKSAAGSFGGGTIVLPALAGTVTQAYALSAQSLSIVRGDSFRLTFNLAADRTGWTPKFAMRVTSTGRYVVATKDATWIDASLGTGYVDVTASENIVLGAMEGEIELRSGAERNTALKIAVVVIDDVVK